MHTEKNNIIAASVPRTATVKFVLCFKILQQALTNPHQNLVKMPLGVNKDKCGKITANDRLTLV